MDYDGPPRRRRTGQYDETDLRGELAFFIAGPLAEHIAEGKSPLGPAGHATIARRCLEREWLPGPRRVDVYQWAREELARRHDHGPDFVDEALAFIAGGALRTAAYTLLARWDEVEQIADRLEAGETVHI